MYQLDIGGVIQRSIGVWTKNALPFVILAAVVNLPGLFLNMGAQALQHGGITSDLGAAAAIVGLVVGIGGVILSIIAQYIISGMICYSVFRTIKGAAPSLQESLSMAMQNLIPIFLLSLLQGVALTLGFIACFIPGVILSLVFYVAMPALVIERLGPVEALQRSNFLTDGHKIYLFVLLLIVGVASAMVGAMVGGCFGGVMIGAAAASGDKNVMLIATVLAQIPTWFVTAVFSTFGATLSTTVYHDLRQMRDGVNVDDLLSVFD